MCSPEGPVVPSSPFDGSSLHLLSPSQDFFSLAAEHVWLGHVALCLVIEPVVVAAKAIGGAGLQVFYRRARSTPAGMGVQAV